MEQVWEVRPALRQLQQVIARLAAAGYPVERARGRPGVYLVAGAAELTGPQLVQLAREAGIV